MVQGYTQENSRSTSGWQACQIGAAVNKYARRGRSGEREILRPYPCGASYDQWSSYLPEKFKLSGVEASDREIGGSMLSVGRIIERKPVKVFSFKTCLVEEHFEMVHYVVPGEKPR